MKQRIHFVHTGGTIDAFYNPVKQTATPRRKSGIPAYFKEIIKPYGKFTHHTVCMKDSNELTESDRRKMATAIRRSTAKHIIITHGTDTMVKTAAFLKKNLGPKNSKVIVLTGSLIPLSGFSGSDSGFNLGFAIAHITQIEPGIYIAMNAEIFKGSNVKKNFKTARFEKSR